jgi:hypothetical protein
MTTDDLFGAIQEHHGKGDWGSVLDAGAGPHSLAWVSGLPARSWKAVTADPAQADALRETFCTSGTPGTVECGSWQDPDLLAGEVFDIVLADYLLGAMDMCSPYYQDQIFARLRGGVGGVLYVVGLEPFPKFPDSPGRELISQIVAARDAAFLLAGERPYREYPQAWVERHLVAAGYKIELSKKFTNVYRDEFVRTQLNVAGAQLAYVPSTALRMALHAHLEGLGERASANPEVRDGVRWGADYVIAARPIS